MCCAATARTADSEELDNAELQALSRRLGRLSPRCLAEVYRKAYEACRTDGGHLPRADAMQKLLIAWKLATAWERRGAGGPAVARCCIQD
jgi:hypothetical protein